MHWEGLLRRIFSAYLGSPYHSVEGRRLGILSLVIQIMHIRGNALEFTSLISKDPNSDVKPTPSSWSLMTESRLPPQILGVNSKNPTACPFF